MRKVQINYLFQLLYAVLIFVTVKNIKTHVVAIGFFLIHDRFIKMFTADAPGSWQAVAKPPKNLNFPTSSILLQYLITHQLQSCSRMSAERLSPVRFHWKNLIIRFNEQGFLCFNLNLKEVSRAPNYDWLKISWLFNDSVHWQCSFLVYRGQETTYDLSWFSNWTS